MREYDQIAEWYASNRRDHIGLPEVSALAGSLPANSRILDIGCGNGVPLSKALISGGHRVVGLDSSSKMLEGFRTHLPATPAVRGIVQACAFAGNVFDAAVAWGIIFHLTCADQAQAIASVSRVLKPGAPFLFTAGDADGEEGHITPMNGVPFHYYSYSADGYGRLLGAHGLTLVDFHKDEWENGYYLARKR